MKYGFILDQYTSYIHKQILLFRELLGNTGYYTSNAPVYNGYAEDELAPKGLTEEANTGGGYYDDTYICASWKLG